MESKVKTLEARIDELELRIKVLELDKTDIISSHFLTLEPSSGFTIENE